MQTTRVVDTRQEAVTVSKWTTEVLNICRSLCGDGHLLVLISLC